MKNTHFSIRSLLLRVAVFAASYVLVVCGVRAQTISGAFSPANVAAGSGSTLVLSYSGFASNSTGLNLRIYFNGNLMSMGTPLHANPPGQSQPFAATVFGSSASCPGADRYVTLNWVDFNATWPTPSSGSALVQIPFTTLASFSSNASVCWVEDLTNGGLQRNISGGAVLMTPAVAVSRSAVSAPDNGTVITYTFNVNQASSTALPLNLSSGVSGAMTGVSNTCGSAITIPANATTATCTISASNTVLFDGPALATVTVNSGTGYNPAGGGANTASAVIFDNDASLAMIDVAKSRKAHGAAGTFDIEIDPAGSMTTGSAITVEPRQPQNGAHQVVFSFNAPVTSAAGGVTAVTQGNVSLPATVAYSGNQATVTIGNTTTAVPNASRVVVTLVSLNGTALSASARLGFLVGDVNGNRVVQGSDVTAVQQRLAMPVDAQSFRADVNANGQIQGSDVTTVQQRLAQTIP